VMINGPPRCVADPLTNSGEVRGFTESSCSVFSLRTSRNWVRVFVLIAMKHKIEELLHLPEPQSLFHKLGGDCVPCAMAGGGARVSESTHQAGEP
jgi:hypothetical protein